MGTSTRAVTCAPSQAYHKPAFAQLNKCKTHIVLPQERVPSPTRRAAPGTGTSKEPHPAGRLHEMAEVVPLRTS